MPSSRADLAPLASLAAFADIAASREVRTAVVSAALATTEQGDEAAAQAATDLRAMASLMAAGVHLCEGLADRREAPQT